MQAARDPQQHWRLLIDAPWLKGTVGFDEGLPIDSAVDMKLDYVDLYTLVKPEQTGSNVEKPVGLTPVWD